jgi:hypothetical protein
MVIAPGAHADLDTAAADTTDCHMAGIDDIHWHGAEHCRATHAYAAGTQAGPGLGNISNHQTLRMANTCQSDHSHVLTTRFNSSCIGRRELQ